MPDAQPREKQRPQFRRDTSINPDGAARDGKLNQLFTAFLTNVSPATANTLAYAMLGVVAVFLISGPIITYIYYRKSKRENSAPAPSPA